jgi:pimeloyl-ACP methyl ester carboxylesterase
MAHWAFRRLSAMLAREGFHVLRFDWTGTGDSWGQVENGTIDAWLEDVAMARQELQDNSGAKHVSVVGMRLGATLAQLACTRNVTAAQLVLWEPVVKGRAYLAELQASDVTANLRLLRDGRRRWDELMGFRVPSALRRALEDVDVLKLPAPHAERVALVTGHDRVDHRELRDALTHAGATVSHDLVPEDPVATNAGQREAALLASRSLAAIVARLTAREPS